MTGFEDGHGLVETVGFDYDAIDEPDPAESLTDNQFLQIQAAFLMELLCWMTEPKTAEAVGRRVLGVVAIARPSLVTKKRGRKSAVDRDMDGAMKVLQKKFGPHFRCKAQKFT
jgi:hypothetical protein